VRRRGALSRRYWHAAARITQNCSRPPAQRNGNGVRAATALCCIPRYMASVLFARYALRSYAARQSDAKARGMSRRSAQTGRCCSDRSAVARGGGRWGRKFCRRHPDVQRMAVLCLRSMEWQAVEVVKVAVCERRGNLRIVKVQVCWEQANSDGRRSTVRAQQAGTWQQKIMRVLYEKSNMVRGVVMRQEGHMRQWL